MTLVLVPETGSGIANANTYQTPAQATAILESRMNSEDWVEAGEIKQTKVLVMAFNLFNVLNWLGDRATVTQAGAWPRTNLLNRFGDAVLAANVIPTDILAGHAALAHYLLPTDRFAAAEQAAVLGASAAGRSRNVSVGHPRNLAIIPAEVWTWISPYVNRTTARLIRAA